MQYDEWRPVIDFTAYDISSQGRVRSWRRKGPGSHMRNQIPFILTPVENKDGYLYVLLYDDDGIRKQGLIHRLILESFVGPCPLGMLTRHLNGKRKDNFLDNLTWGTPLENTQDSIRHGTMSNTSIQSWTKLNYEKVREIKELLNQGIKSSIIAKNYEVSYGTINQIKKGLTWKETVYE